MKYVISLQGPMASGKTTLAKRLEQQGMKIIYENPYPIVEKSRSLKLDICTKEGFITNQNFFIEAKIKEYQSVQGDIIIFDRGPEDIEFYTIHYPKIIGVDWEIEKELREELQQLRECRSNAIFYLTVSKEVLQQRKEKDITRRRSTFEEQLELVEAEQRWYKQFPVTYVDVDKKKIEEVEMYFMKWMEENHM
ncbi:AAA family ATPase [Bacillus sp. DX4.1]|uniref:AAA family ATPase n=1 Tax=Bacillus sp. DX4.1 TaxID=3055867 RepID=UPI0025A2D1D2|nr:AAA family ATPase [Bacillus sp. DX4.1]MDM5189304.1 AAA family ATPase [Bacillus sp. DX4.1]